MQISASYVVGKSGNSPGKIEKIRQNPIFGPTLQVPEGVWGGVPLWAHRGSPLDANVVADTRPLHSCNDIEVATNSKKLTCNKSFQEAKFA